MLSNLTSVCAKGIDGVIVSVEVDVAPGLPTFTIVGLPETEIKESRERVAAAIRNSGFDFPLKKITVNLGPAELKKSGTHFDLPIAAGVLAASGQISESGAAGLSNMALAGELSLDGAIRPVAGVLPMLLALADKGFAKAFIPMGNCGEADVERIQALTCPSLKDFINALEGKARFSPCRSADGGQAVRIEDTADLSEVKGQQLAKRALEIAAAGGHNFLMIGPPGSGKSMLAKRFSGILPPMTQTEAVEVTKIYSVCGLLANKRLMNARPFRDPHHSISDVALIGGGTNPRPGEVSLAHNGVLFLDEFPEFSRTSLEVLRQPLESFRVTISRAKETVVFPARFTLIAAMNPCPCGYYGSSDRQCTCTPLQAARYRSKISGPLFDRIDMSVQLSSVKYNEWRGHGEEERSATVKARVLQARAKQAERFSKSSTTANAFMTVAETRRFCVLPEGGGALLESAMKRLGLSARSLDKILRTSRTIADLESSGEIKKEHIMEAIQYRSVDRIGVYA